MRLTILDCATHWHSARSPCCATAASFQLQNVSSPKETLSPFLQPLATRPAPGGRQSAPSLRTDAFCLVRTHGSRPDVTFRAWLLPLRGAFGVHPPSSRCPRCVPFHGRVTRHVWMGHVAHPRQRGGRARGPVPPPGGCERCCVNMGARGPVGASPAILLSMYRGGRCCVLG